MRLVVGRLLAGGTRPPIEAHGLLLACLVARWRAVGTAMRRASPPTPVEDHCHDTDDDREGEELLEPGHTQPLPSW